MKTWFKTHIELSLLASVRPVINNSVILQMLHLTSSLKDYPDPRPGCPWICHHLPFVTLKR